MDIGHNFLNSFFHNLLRYLQVVIGITIIVTHAELYTAQFQV